MNWKNIAAGAIIVAVVCWAYKHYRKPATANVQQPSSAFTATVDSQVQQTQQVPNVQPVYQAQPIYPNMQPIYPIPGQQPVFVNPPVYSIPEQQPQQK